MLGIFKKKEETDKPDQPYMARYSVSERCYVVDNNTWYNRSIYTFIWVGSYEACEGAAEAENKIIETKKRIKNNY